MKRKIVFWILLLLLLFPSSQVLADTFEEVYVHKIFQIDCQAIIIRENGDIYLIDYGLGVSSIWKYEGKTIYIKYPGTFLGIGSKIYLFDDDKEARIWSNDYLGNINDSDLPKVIPTESAIDNYSPPITNNTTTKTGNNTENRTVKYPYEINIKINGQKVELDTPAASIDDRTFLPLKEISELLDQKVSWNQVAKIAMIEKDGFLAYFEIDHTNVVIFDPSADLKYSEIILDVPPSIIKDKTYIPLRAVSQIFGIPIEWDSDTSTINITL